MKKTILPMRSFVNVLAVTLVTFVSSGVFGQSSQEINEYIASIDLKTYDCPEEGLIEGVNKHLSSPELSILQKNQLLSRKTHWLICEGQHEEAETLLKSLLEDKDADVSQQYFASAVYQLGYILDVQENPARCEMYSRAESLANGKFADVHLSSQLGLITECEENTDDGVKLGSLYALLEQYLVQSDNASLAHIHSNIGILYANLGQHVLAAEQYYKAYELGLEVYTGSNKIATLVSAISSQMASGAFEKARLSIAEFKRVNSTIDTPLSNNGLHLSEAGYHYRTGNIEELKNSLARWEIYLGQINSSIYTGVFRWYRAVVCLAEENIECLQAFLWEESQTSPGYKAFINRNKDYLKFLTDIYLFMGETELAKETVDKYSKVMLKKYWDQQASGKVLGVANLHNQIVQLEATLVENQSSRRSFILMAVLSALFIIVIVSFVLHRKYKLSAAYDSVTKLLNSQGAMTQIRRVTAPSNGRINALALFDLGNFRDVNRQVGAANSEQALQQIASTLSKITRENDIIGRFAPEQFIVCLTDIEEHTAKSFFERMRFALESTSLSEQHGEHVSIRSSMSIYIANAKFDDLDDVLNDMQLSLEIRT